MADHLPLLVFPQAKTVEPSKGNGFPPSKPHFPNHGRQVERIAAQLMDVQQDFSRYKANVGGAVSGFEPETVLVIEIAGKVEDFKRAVDSTPGLEWLGEWDIEDIEPDEDFYDVNSKGVRTEKSLTGRLFLSVSNDQGLRELLILWNKWEKGQELPFAKTKWRDVFAQAVKIRRWGIEETLRETGMIDRWSDLINPINSTQEIHCQIEMFYRQNRAKRIQNEAIFNKLLSEIQGKTLSPFIDMPEIAFHAVKVALPGSKIRRLLDVLNSPNSEIDIQLFKFSGIMYFRPTGQNVTDSVEDTGEPGEFTEGAPDLSPIAAILDGAPNLLHEALKERLLFDDPDNLAGEYLPGERRHGTAMASLVVHGELGDLLNTPLAHKVFFVPVMQPNKQARIFDKHVEYFPDEIFLEDRIQRAVRRMFEGEGNIPAQAPGIKIINLSIGDRDRPFIHTPSPWARLLDWLSWKYRVLFCVSAGNFKDKLEVGIPYNEFSALSDEQKVDHVLKCIGQQLSARRLLSPAESLNSLTVGALHRDNSGTYSLGRRIDLLPNSALFSPISRFGYGFRRSIKPEIYFSGGRQLYNVPFLDSGKQYSVDEGLRVPGQQVAWDSTQEGELSQKAFTRGTSNATALATRGGIRIYEVLAKLQAEQGEQIPENLIAVLIKTLLVHGAKHDDQAERRLEALRTPQNSHRFKEVIARYIGYGAVNIERVLACTEQRATVLGCSEIRENQVHEYRFPLPLGLSGRKVWRCMVVTLAWFSPINSAHRNLREAKLELQPAGKWAETELKLSRQEADYNQVLRGTVQHEILEGEKQTAIYQDDGHILLHVTCKADATEKLDDAIPYGLAVTLEVEEGIDIPIYQQIRARIKPQVAVIASVEK